MTLKKASKNDQQVYKDKQIISLEADKLDELVSNYIFDHLDDIIEEHIEYIISRLELLGYEFKYEDDEEEEDTKEDNFRRVRT